MTIGPGRGFGAFKQLLKQLAFVPSITSVCICLTRSSAISGSLTTRAMLAR